MRVLAPLIALLVPRLALACVCGDPCLEAARGDYRECRQAATAALVLGRQLCLDRDLACVQACATLEVDCGAATGIGPALDACLGQQQAAIAECRNRSPLGSKKRETCIDNARIAGFQCRNRARDASASALRRCRVEFDACADGCGPVEAPPGSRQCKRDARRVRQAALAVCNRTATADKSACVNKDPACAESCREVRASCDEPVRLALASAVAACEIERRATIATCESANPNGGASLEQCIEDADTAAFVCRDTAAEAQTPAFVACAQGYVTCVRACPAA